MSIWFKNANIFTADASCPRAESVVVTGGFFAFVGSDAEAEAYIRTHVHDALEAVDCGGAFIMSGFNDSHMHFLHYVRAKKTSVDLGGCKSLKATLERMKTALERDFDPSLGLYLTGEGWNQDLFTDEKRFPTAKELDAVTSEYPMLIMRSCFHVGVLNTKAMELMGINRGFAEEHEDCIELDERGEPNGVVKEGILDEVKSRMPLPSVAQLSNMMLECQKDLFACGITSIQSDDFKYAPKGREYELMHMLRQAAELGTLKLRMAQQALLPANEDMDEFFVKHGFDDGFGNRRFKISCVKLLADGSLGARTAYMRSPYADDVSTRGIAVYTQQELNALVLRAHGNNMAAIIHAIGDGAIEMCINAIENARCTMPHLHPRHGIVHCQITDKELLYRMAANDIIAYIQPVFISSDMHIVSDRVGEKLASASYAWRDMLSLNIHAPFGTDCPVESFNPLYGIYCAVSRCALDGSGPFLREQRLDRESALYAYSAAGAYCTGEENVKGRIKAGMYADFVILDTDLLSCPERDILSAEVLATFISGECVHKA